MCVCVWMCVCVFAVLSLINSGFLGWVISPSVTKKHCNNAQKNTQRYPASDLSTSLSFTTSARRHRWLTAAWWLALQCGFTYNLLSWCLTVSVPLSWRRSCCRCDPSPPAQRPVRLGLRPGSAGPPTDPGSHLSDWTWWQSSSGTWEEHFVLVIKYVCLFSSKAAKGQFKMTRRPVMIYWYKITINNYKDINYISIKK